MLQITEVAMNKLDANAAFANARGNAFNGTMANITDSEDARNIGFE